MFVTLVGDIHGCFKSMMALLEKLPKTDNRVIFLGDLINKGPRSYQVYQYVKKKQLECIKGNHEFYCIHRNSDSFKANWNEQGGKETERSITRAFPLRGAAVKEEVLHEMSLFFSTLPDYLWCNIPYLGRVLLTHGGISSSWYRENRFHVQHALDEEENPKKPYFFNKDVLAQIPEVTQMIGHQPTANAPLKRGCNYFIDSGCVYKHRKGMGYLSAMVFSQTENVPPSIIKQTNID